MKESFLPEITEVAARYGIRSIRSLCHRLDEYRANCPFCIKNGLKTSDKGKHLYINSHKKTFKCFRCLEGGGVIRFISLMEGKAEKEIIKEIKINNNIPEKPKKPHHPALGLTGYQLRLIHLAPRYEWPQWWSDDPVYKKWWLDEVWRRWNEYVDNIKSIAYTLLCMAIKSGNYTIVTHALKSFSEPLNIDLITPCMTAYSSPELQWWALKGKSRAIRLMYELENNIIIRKGVF